MSDVFVISVTEMKRGLLTINSKRYNNLDNQQIKNRDMNTTKKWSLVAVLCGLLAATLLTACGGGGSVWTEPNLNKEDTTSSQKSPTASIEQILTLKANRLVSISYFGFGFFDVYVNGEKKDSSFSGSLEVRPNAETTIYFKAIPNSFNPEGLEALKLELEFILHAKEPFAIDPELDNQPNPLKPIPTIVTFAWQERINGEVTREESQTVKLYDPDNNAEYKSKKYKTEAK